MARRYSYATTLSWGGDEPTAEVEVVVSFTVAWGSPETGRFGPPENYDPGCPHEVEDIWVEMIDGRDVSASPGWIVPILEKLEDLRDEMIAEAVEAEAAARDDAVERRHEDRREVA